MERLLTPVEAADLLRVELDTVYTWVSQRRIPFQKVGRALRFSPIALRSWLAEQAWPPESDEEDPGP